MQLLRLLGCFCVLSSVVAAQAPGRPSQIKTQLPNFPLWQPDVDRGRELFTRKFSPALEDKSGRRPMFVVNGLGPMFNASSCAGCHNQSGSGGSGANDSNVILLGIATRPQPKSIPAAIAEARRHHPMFSEDSAVQVIHKALAGDDEAMRAYQRFRTGIFNEFGGLEAPTASQPLQKDYGDVTLQLAQRNTTALWGLESIEQLRTGQGDAIRERIAADQRRRTPWITGRVPYLADGSGWYGWRGQVSQLDEFVRSACSIEMGLKVAGSPEPQNPLATNSPARSDGKSQQWADLSTFETGQLTSFVRSLPRPPIPHYTHEEQQGRQVFEDIGCADCHTPDLGEVQGLYSDMLLHDMGPSYADPQSAPTAMRMRHMTKEVSHYYNVKVTTTTTSTASYQTNVQQEWKTPPLWGVRDSYPYLHDGRAATLNDAIEMHGGEADRSAAKFRLAPPEERLALLAFLEAQRAPGDSPDPPVQADSTAVITPVMPPDSESMKRLLEKIRENTRNEQSRNNR